jgi:hypothetical protein
MTYDAIAVKLKLSPQDLERESLRLFLSHRLRLIDSRRLELGHRYGVRTISELDALVQAGRVHEIEAFEDYFELDALEAERDAVLESLKDIA